MLVLKNFSKFFNVLGQIMAFLTIVLLGLLYLNDILPVKFLGDYQTILTSIKDYAVILTITVCGLAFAVKRNILIFVLFCGFAVCALACYSISIFG